MQRWKPQSPAVQHASPQASPPTVRAPQVLRVALLTPDPASRQVLGAVCRREQLVVLDAGSPEALKGADVVLWDGRSEGSPEPHEIQSNPPWVVVVANPQQAAALLQRGVRGIVPREVEPRSLRATLEAVAQGLVVVPAELGAALGEPRRRPVDPTVHLSPREREVLELLAEGLSNKEIAQTLGVSPHTAKFHVTQLLTHFGAETRTEAVVRAARAGLLAL